MLGVRLFRYIDANETVKQMDKDQRLYAFVVPLFVVEVCLRAVFPGFRDLIHDWASFSHWFLIFLAGYLMANNIEILDNATKLRYRSLALAMVSTAILFFGFYTADGFHLNRDEAGIVVKYVLFCAIRMVMVWSILLTCLGFAGRHLQKSNAALNYLNEAVYPLFILHLTVITILDYFVVTWPIALWSKYLFITAVTIMSVLVSYHWLIRPYNIMRLLFGVREK